MSRTRAMRLGLFVDHVSLYRGHHDEIRLASGTLVLLALQVLTEGEELTVEQLEVVLLHVLGPGGPDGGRQTTTGEAGGDSHQQPTDWPCAWRQPRHKYRLHATRWRPGAGNELAAVEGLVGSI